MNIVIPMAGLGSRFAKAGFDKPKPFMDVLGKPMVVRVLENLRYKDARYILIARKEHLIKEKKLVDEIKNNFNVEFIAIDKLTQGTACTVLYARKYINNDTPLMIANSDQIVDVNITDFINDGFKRGLDGSILTFIDKEKNSKWSFVRLKGDLVVEVKEKEAISEFATVGIYLFNKGKIFVESAIDMIIENDRVNNEFYTCPVYNYAIKNGAKIGVYNIEDKQMHGIGTPEDLEKYKKYKEIDELSLITRDQCPITYSKNIEIINSRQFPLFCGCIEQDQKKDIICEEQFAVCRDSGVLFLNKLIPLDILYKNGHYAGNIGKIWDEHHKEFAKFIFQIRPKNILEIGGGHGKLSQFFLEMDNVNWTIVEPNIENKFENVNYIDGFFSKDICNNKQYDTIIHSHVLEHVYDPNEFFSEISSFLNNDKGYIIFSIPNMSKWLKNKYSNCLFFEHTILLDENVVDYILGNNNFTIIVKKYFKEHSIFYLAKKDVRSVKITLENKYLENKVDFGNMLRFYKNKVEYINSYIKQTPKKVYLFGAHLFSQNLIYSGLDTLKIVCILDNDLNKQKKRLYGTKFIVRSPKILINDSNALVILNAGIYNDEIEKDIIENINNKIEIIKC